MYPGYRLIGQLFLLIKTAISSRVSIALLKHFTALKQRTSSLANLSTSRLYWYSVGKILTSDLGNYEEPLKGSGLEMPDLPEDQMTI